MYKQKKKKNFQKKKIKLFLKFFEWERYKYINIQKQLKTSEESQFHHPSQEFSCCAHHEPKKIENTPINNK